MSSDLLARLRDFLGTAYQLDRELGGGGMSRVFLATERSLGREVVIKVLPRELAHVSPERFQREIALAARLQHPHIVPLLAAGEVDGLPWYTMPFVKGESLRARLQQGGEIEVAEAVRLLREVAAALAYAHEHGIVHRDLKPENVLLSAGSAMLTDFGVAKALSVATGSDEGGLTSVGMALGTPAYMAPEQAAADPNVDHRADLYAWGVLAYEVLTGSAPFAGRPSAAMLAAHAIETPEALEKRKPGIPTGLAALVMRCLEKRPDDRPQRASEVMSALDSLGTPAAGTTTRATGNRRRRIALTGGVVSVAIVAAAAFYRGRASRTEPVTSLAVLPADVTAGDSTLDYLADGLTDGLQEEMRRSGLRVAARASTSWFKGKAAKPQDVARELDVQSVLTISLRRLGSRLRVSAELYDAKGFALWNGAVERDAADPVAIEDEVVRALVSAFRSELSNRSVTLTARVHAPDAETYELYMRGHHWLNDPTRAGLEKARDYFLAATRRDSLYAPAYADLAVAYMWLADTYEKPTVVLPLARDAARRAIAADSNSSVALAAFGEIEGLYFRNWEVAEAALKRAIAIDSTNAEAHVWLGWIAGSLGRQSEGIPLIMKAVRLNPLWPWGLGMAGLLLAWSGQPDSALKMHARLQEIAPGWFFQEPWAADAFRMSGQLDRALAEDEAGEKVLGRPPMSKVLTLAKMGRREEALNTLQVLEARQKAGEYLVPEWMARAWLVMGNPDRALDYLELGLENISIGVGVVPWLPEMRNMPRTDRFKRYLKNANLTYMPLPARGS